MTGFGDGKLFFARSYKMLKMLRCKFILPAGLLVLFVMQNSFAAGSNSRPLVAPELLKHAKLKVLWENELPIKKNENLDRLLLLDNRLYAISNRNYLVYLNKKNGKIIFGRTIAPADFPTAKLKPYDDELLSVDGSRLIQIDAQSGTERKQMDAGFRISCPAARNSTYIYLAGIDNRLHVFRAKDRVKTFEVAAENDSLITSILAEENFVIFGTAAGNIISIAPDTPQRLWQFDASKAIAGPIVKDGMSLFFASKDTNVYRVDIVGIPERKRLAWKYQTAAVLDKAPRVTQGIVYQHVHGKGLSAINKATGALLWSVTGGIDLLAESRNRAYVITNTGTLVVMDNVKAKKLYSANFAEVSKYASNITDDIIYIADNRGRIACLQPVE
jgi:outer membrane protein assembly factor BamB